MKKTVGVLMVVLVLGFGTAANADMILHHTNDTAHITGTAPGSTVYDQSGGSYDGTIMYTGDPLVNPLIGITNPTGVVNEALGFPGSHYEGVDVADAPALNPGTGSWSVSGWFNVADVEGVQGLLGKNVGLSGEECFDIYTNGDNIYTRIGQYEGEPEPGVPLYNRYQTAKRDFIELDTWYHLAMVLDRDTGNLTGYINGSTLGWDFDGAGIAVPAGRILTDKPVTFGRTIRPDGSPGWNLNGALDDVGFFNEALSAGQVDAIYQRGLVGLAVPEPATIILLSLGGLLLRRRR